MSGFIPDETVAEVLRVTDIVEVVGAYLPLKQAGRSLKALCPFHTEKTPSFVVNPDRQIFYCFGCQEGGDVFRFVMRREGFTFPEAVRHLAERAGIPIPERHGRGQGDGRLRIFELQRAAAHHFSENLRRAPEAEKARSYLAGRGIGQALMDQFQLGYALDRWDGLLRSMAQRGFSISEMEAGGLIVPRRGKGGHYDRFRDRVIIPIADSTGKVIGFGGRALGGGEPKYLNSPETSIYRKGAHLYALHVASRSIRESGYAVLVEGFFDAIQLYGAGVAQAVATLGTALTAKQVELLSRYTDRVLFVFDPDRAGVQAAWRGLEIGVERGLTVGVVSLPAGEDPDLFIRKVGGEAFAERIAAAEDPIDFLLGRTHTEATPSFAGIDDRARAGHRVLDLIRRMDPGIRRTTYIQKLAGRLGVPEAAILADLSRLRSPGGAASPPEIVRARPAMPAAEKTLMQVLLLFPDVRAEVMASCCPETFTVPSLQAIARFFAAYRGDEAGLVAALNQHPDEEVRRVATELLVQPPEAYAEEPARVAADCLGRLRQEDIRRRTHAAQRAGDVEKARELLREKRNLQGTGGEAGENAYIT